MQRAASQPQVVLIQLSRGMTTQVDEQDSWVDQSKWSVRESRNGTFYAGRTHRDQITGKRVEVRLHRLIMNATPGVLVDHVDGDGLNNRRLNLRLATRIQNSQNRKVDCDNTSGFKGVSFDKIKKKWRSRIRSGGPTRFLGYFDSPTEAALAYDEACMQLHGEFARTNF